MQGAEVAVCMSLCLLAQTEAAFPSYPWAFSFPEHPAMTLQNSCLPSATGTNTEGHGAEDAHAMPTALGDASTCSVVENWLTKQCAVHKVLAAIPCPTVQNMWLSKGSRLPGKAVRLWKGVGAQLPTKNFCLLHSPKKVSAHFMDNIWTRSFPVPPEKCPQNGL